MDIFLEYLMKKKPKSGEGIIKFLLVIAAVILMIIVFMACLLIPSIGGTIAIFGAALVVYGAYYLLGFFNSEFEYIFTNGDLDIDTIRAKKTRKRVVSVNCKDIELMAELSDEKYGAQFQNGEFENIYDAVYDSSLSNVYGIIYKYDGVRNLIKFQPTGELVDGMRLFNPRNIYKKVM